MFGESRIGFYIGAAAALVASIFLLWLWRPEHQVRLHSANLLKAAEKRNWARLSEMVDASYHDQWHNDHNLLVERTREVFRYLRAVKFTAALPIVWTENETGHWQSQITVGGEPGEGLTMIQQRINTLKMPFDFQWRHVSSKPWDWKLVRVENADLAIPEFGD